MVKIKTQEIQKTYRKDPNSQTLSLPSLSKILSLKLRTPSPGLKGALSTLAPPDSNSWVIESFESPSVHQKSQESTVQKIGIDEFGFERFESQKKLRWQSAAVHGVLGTQNLRPKACFINSGLIATKILLSLSLMLRETCQSSRRAIRTPLHRVGWAMIGGTITHAEAFMTS